LQAKSTCTRLTACGASETVKSHPRLLLNIGILTAVHRTPRKDDADRNSKLNKKITIIKHS